MKKNMQFYDIFYGLSPNYFFNVKFDKLDGVTSVSYDVWFGLVWFMVFNATLNNHMIILC